jgi:hypothetical protein
MVEFPIITVIADEGIVENVHMWLEEPNGSPTEELRGIKETGEISQQLLLARQIACFFLGRTYVIPAIHQTLQRGKIIAEFESGALYKGQSLGLAFLIGCLALGFNVPINKGLLFSAGLTELLDYPGWAGGGCRLKPVTGMAGKIAGACINQKSRLYHYSGDEKTTLDFERAFWGGEIDRSCLPCLLPEYLPTCALVGLALDTEKLFYRTIEKPNVEVFILQMLYASNYLQNGICFPKGIGFVLSALRKEGKLENVAMLDELTGALNLPRIYNGELFVSYVFEQCIENNLNESNRFELIKAAISRDPKLPIFISYPAKNVTTMHSALTDLDQWLEQETNASPYLFRRNLAVLALCERLVPDMAFYWPKARKLVLESLQRQFDHITGLLDRGMIRESLQHLALLMHTSSSPLSLGSYLGRIRQEWIPEARSITVNYLNKLKGIAPEPVIDILERLYNNLKIHYVPDVLKPLEANEQEPLVLTFQLADPKAPNSKELSEYPRPSLTTINDLELNVSGQNKLSLRIPSPVLLMEHCSEQHGAFGRRKGMTLSDDTLNRYPINDAGVVSALFGNSVIANRIRFRFESNSGGEYASIKWAPSVNPWPPAIDSQLFVAAMVQYSDVIQPKNLLEVGCGTAYLCIAAAHRWPTLNRVELLDIDPLAVAAAKVNWDSDPTIRKVHRAAHATDFKHYNGKGFDIVLCAPPYLPERTLRVTGIEMATNGTLLLEEVVERSAFMARELWIGFSMIAWPEFQRALARVPHAYSNIEVLRRDVVPFRIPWLEPTDWEKEKDPAIFREKVLYYERILMPRGLIDMDNHKIWHEHLQDYAPNLPENCTAQLSCHVSSDDIEKYLDEAEQDSRGYRFWHEIRTLRLVTAS